MIPRAPHLAILQSIFQERRGRNASYSLRSFARDLDLSVSFLSKVMNGHRGVSAATARKMGDALGLSAKTHEDFLRSAVLGEQTCTPSEEHFLAHSAFRLIRDWHHGALLELFKLGPAMRDPKVAAARLGLRPAQVREAMMRLRDLGLLEGDTEEGAAPIQPVFAHIEIASKRDEGVRHYHEQMLQMAQASLSNVPSASRDISGFQIASSLERIAHAKLRIRAFRKELQEILAPAEGEAADAVLACEIALFPVTRS